MDILRACYKSQMRLYRDRPDVLTWGEWHWCPPGAILAPPSVFMSRRWDKENKDSFQLGEVYATHYPYSKGVSDPRYTGQHYCGEEAWSQGILYEDRPGLVTDITGMPLCCQSNPATPGGAIVGGQGVWPGVYFAVQGGNVCGCGTVAGPTTILG